MFAYEHGSFSLSGEVECCAIDSGIVPFAVSGRDCASCGDACSGSGCDYTSQSEIEDYRI